MGGEAGAFSISSAGYERTRGQTFGRVQYSLGVGEGGRDAEDVKNAPKNGREKKYITFCPKAKLEECF